MNPRPPERLDPSARPASRRFGQRPDDDFLWFELFAQLPLLAPSAGFRDRVLAALARPSVSSLPRRYWFDSVWGRAGLAAALAGVAISAAILLPAAFSLARLAGPAAIVSLWIGAIGELFGGLGESLATWGRLADIGRATGLALVEPRALTLLIANVGLAIVSIRGLIALTPQRRSTHVSAHS